MTKPISDSPRGEILSPGEYFKDARQVETPSGRIGYVERGSGPVALFVHGVLLNGWFWRHQLSGLSDIRRCIAPDLLAHGRTEIGANQEVSVTANARMLGEFLDALKIDQVDLIGNDSGGGICQIFAAVFPERVRSITLTNCDTHDNWPPEAFIPFVKLVQGGGLPNLLSSMLKDKNIYRSPQALGPAYERPEAVSDETIAAYLAPHTRTPQRARDLERFVEAFDNEHTVLIKPQLRALKVPALIVWGDDDIYFDVKWSQWLEKTLPGPTRRVILKGARIFFPEERADMFNKELRAFWHPRGIHR
jgi:pimeloyl-ACP methyl ester carboxylesterase